MVPAPVSGGGLRLLPVLMEGKEGQASMVREEERDGRKALGSFQQPALRENSCRNEQSENSLIIMRTAPRHS